MSTRANIIVEQGSSILYVYRHCDGYPSELGADLLLKLRAAGNASRFIESLLAERYEKQSYEPAARPVYEVTTEIHGDIDYLYRVVFPDWAERRQEAEIGVLNLTFRGGNEQLRGRAVRLHVAPIEQEKFREFVNGEIRAANSRLAELAAKQPQAFGSYSPQPEIEPVTKEVA